MRNDKLVLKRHTYTSPSFLSSESWLEKHWNRRDITYRAQRRSYETLAILFVKLYHIPDSVGGGFQSINYVRRIADFAPRFDVLGMWTKWCKQPLKILTSDVYVLVTFKFVCFTLLLASRYVCSGTCLRRRRCNVPCFSGSWTLATFILYNV